MSDRITTSKLEAMKTSGEKFVMVTAYDSTFARLVSDAGAECILVGDSLGMVLQGHETTVPVSLEAMVYHTECVARARPKSMIVADLPFMTYSSPDVALSASMELMQQGAQMVKLEGGTWLSDTIHQLVQRGIPVCAHLGLTPQSVNVFGGYRVMGRTPKEAKSILAKYYPEEQPDAIHLWGFAGAQVFTEALQRMGDGPITRDGLVETLEGIDGWEGSVVPSVTIGEGNAPNHFIVKDMSFVVYEGGEFKDFTPPWM